MTSDMAVHHTNASRVIKTWFVDQAKTNPLHAACNATRKVFERFVPNLLAQFDTLQFTPVIVVVRLLLTRGRLGEVSPYLFVGCAAYSPPRQHSGGSTR